jgi:hypothetical protein
MVRATNARGDCDSFLTTDNNGIGFRTGGEVRIDDLDDLRETDRLGSPSESSRSCLGLSKGIECPISLAPVSEISNVVVGNWISGSWNGCADLGASGASNTTTFGSDGS